MNTHMYTNIPQPHTHSVMPILLLIIIPIITPKPNPHTQTHIYKYIHTCLSPYSHLHSYTSTHTPNTAHLISFFYFYFFFSLISIFHSKFTRTIQSTHCNQHHYTPYCSQRWVNLIHSYVFFIYIFKIFYEGGSLNLFKLMSDTNTMRNNESDISACLLKN